MTTPEFDESPCYVVAGAEEQGPYDDDVQFVIYGVFDDYDTALSIRDLHLETNTTLVGTPMVLSSTHFSGGVGRDFDLDVFLLISVDEGIIRIRTIPASSSMKPMLYDEEIFEAVGEMPHKEKLLELARQWHIARYGFPAEIDDDTFDAEAMI